MRDLLIKFMEGINFIAVSVTRVSFEEDDESFLKMKESYGKDPIFV